MKYDIYSHGDFKVFYDITLKKYYWILGYFGGGDINISEIYKLAEDFSKMYNTPIEDIYVGEILTSSRYKYFKYITTQAKIEKIEDNLRCYEYENVWKMLTL